MAAFKGCPSHEKVMVVQKVRDENKVSYAEAVRRIEGASGSGQATGPVRPQQVFSKVPDD